MSFFDFNFCASFGMIPLFSSLSRLRKNSLGAFRSAGFQPVTP
jgi:hypothetical protein